MLSSVNPSGLSTMHTGGSFRIWRSLLNTRRTHWLTKSRQTFSFPRSRRSWLPRSLAPPGMHFSLCAPRSASRSRFRCRLPATGPAAFLLLLALLLRLVLRTLRGFLAAIGLTVHVPACLSSRKAGRDEQCPHHYRYGHRRSASQSGFTQWLYLCSLRVIRLPPSLCNRGA